MACSGLRHLPYAGGPVGAQLPDVGKMGVIKLKRVHDVETDIYGDCTHAKYAFSTKAVLYVDVRDAAYMLGKDFILAG